MFNPKRTTDARNPKPAGKRKLPFSIKTLLMLLLLVGVAFCIGTVFGYNLAPRSAPPEWIHNSATAVPMVTPTPFPESRSMESEQPLNRADYQPPSFEVYLADDVFYGRD